ncbi:MAG: antibiotic biosynthesis monooxygenase [Myxococcales bacterium]|nr:MAG: antibiotic biosynthesis monooxygenase [Myxococcales bacterium]
MIIIAGTLHVDPARRDEYLALTADVAVKARQAPGCLDFVQSADPIEPGRINIHERWESDADVEAFRRSGGPSPELPGIRQASVKKYRIAGVEAP